MTERVVNDRTAIDVVQKYDAMYLPERFSYPETFLNKVGKARIEGYYPWYFLTPRTDSERNSIFSIPRKFDHPYVPFAQLDLWDGHYACFDGTDSSGDPQVIELNMEYGTIVKRHQNFAAWEDEAKKLALDFI